MIGLFIIWSTGFIFKGYELYHKNETTKEQIKIHLNVIDNDQAKYLCQDIIQSRTTLLDHLQFWNNDNSMNLCIEYNRILTQSSIPNPLTILYHLFISPFFLSWSRWDQYMFFLFIALAIYLSHKIWH